VKVTFDGRSTEVALASIAHDAPATAVPLLAIWATAWPEQDPAPLRFDFVGSDGFRSTTRPKCARPLSGAELASARVDVATHDLLLDDPALPGCYRVHALVAIDAARP
jgi:hypothetical protein